MEDTNNNITVIDEIVSGTAIPNLNTSKLYSIHEHKPIMNIMTAKNDFLS